MKNNKKNKVLSTKPIDLKNSKKKKTFIKFVFWLVSLVFAAQAFSFKIPYCIVIGFMSISIGFTIFPFLDNITNVFKVTLSRKNKFFIIGMSFLITAYSLKPDDKSYIKCILPIVLMLLVWVFTIIYKRKKVNNENNGNKSNIKKEK